MSDSLIHLHGLKKVFLTDEIETNALAGIYLEILKGEYVRSQVRADAVSPLCCRFLGFSIRPVKAPIC